MNYLNFVYHFTHQDKIIFLLMFVLLCLLSTIAILIIEVQAIKNELADEHATRRYQQRRAAKAESLVDRYRTGTRATGP
jgi:predicted Holliday junction resolvase-like endonuclease